MSAPADTWSPYEDARRSSRLRHDVELAVAIAMASGVRRATVARAFQVSAPTCGRVVSRGWHKAKVESLSPEERVAVVRDVLPPDAADALVSQFTYGGAGFFSRDWGLS